jgi:hypothetical protein
MPTGVFQRTPQPELIVAAVAPRIEPRTRGVQDLLSRSVGEPAVSWADAPSASRRWSLFLVDLGCSLQRTRRCVGRIRVVVIDLPVPADVPPSSTNVLSVVVARISFTITRS